MIAVSHGPEALLERRYILRAIIRNDARWRYHRLMKKKMKGFQGARPLTPDCIIHLHSGHPIQVGVPWAHGALIRVLWAFVKLNYKWLGGRREPVNGVKGRAPCGRGLERMSPLQENVESPDERAPSGEIFLRRDYTLRLLHSCGLAVGSSV